MGETSRGSGQASLGGGRGGVWIASTPLHNIICVQAQPHKLIIFTISAMIKIILDNYDLFLFFKISHPQCQKF